MGTATSRGHGGSCFDAAVSEQATQPSTALSTSSVSPGHQQTDLANRSIACRPMCPLWSAAKTAARAASGTRSFPFTKMDTSSSAIATWSRRAQRTQSVIHLSWRTHSRSILHNLSFSEAALMAMATEDSSSCPLFALIVLALVAAMLATSSTSFPPAVSSSEGPSTGLLDNASAS